MKKLNSIFLISTITFLFLLIEITSNAQTLPTASNNTVTTNENVDFVFSALDFQYYDADGDAFYQIEVVATTDKGTLYLDANTNGIVDGGEAVSNSDSILVTNFNILKFKPIVDENGANYDSLSFKVDDNNDGFSTATYSITIDVIAVANAGNDQTICTDNTNLNANPSSGYWTIITGVGNLQTPTLFNTPVTNILPGINIFRWTLDPGGAFDDVTITNNQTSAIITTTNFSTTVTSATIQAQDPIQGFGLWTVPAGGSTINNPTSYITEVTNLAQGVNIFRWTVTQSSCSDFDELTITKTTTASELDSLALVALYNSTDGANWSSNTNWLTGNLNTWFGVTMIGDRVTELYLVSNNLVGTIPSDIGNLTNLTDLGLSENQLSGIIPIDIGNLTNLTSLYLDNNQLSGSIPSEVGNLANLTYLSLYGNQLNSLPDLSALVNLNNVNISNNNFTFADLATANITAEIYTYTPQKELTLNQTNFNVEENSNFTLDILTFSDNQISDANNTYQWYYNGSPIGGATAPTYTIADFLPANEGTYYCEIQNSNFPLLTLKSQDIIIEIPTTIEAGLVAYYPFNGNANDESGNGNDGIAYNGSFPEDRFGNLNSACLSDSVVVPDADILDLSNEYTMVVWTKTPSGNPFGNGEDGTNYPLISKYGDNGQDAYGIRTNDTRTLSTYVYNGSTYSILDYSSPLDYTTWYQIAVTRSSDDSLKMYVNGVFVNGISNAGIPQASTSTLNFGAVKQMGMFVQEFYGTIDDIFIYNRTLSETEILELYNRPGSAYAGIDQEVCDTTAQLSADDPSPYAGEWFTTSTGTGTFADATNHITQVNGLLQGINEFEWTVDIEGIIYRDTVAVTNNTIPAFAGNDTTIYWQTYPIPTAEMQMRAAAVEYPAVGLWSTNSSSAWFENSTLPNTMVYDLSAGINRLTWTVSNQACVTSDDVLIFSSNNIHNNGSGSWNNPTSWIPQVVPSQWDSVTITNGTIDITGYDGHCRRLRVKDNGTLIVQEDMAFSPGNLYGGEIWIEQEVEKAGKGNANLYIKQGGTVWIEQEVEKALYGRGLIVGSGGMVSIEQEVEKNSKGNPAQLYVQAGKSIYVSATQPLWSSPDANLYLGNNGYIWIEQEVEKAKTKGFANSHGLYIGSGGLVSIEQEVEKGKAFSGLTVRNGGLVSIEQEVEKGTNALNPGTLHLLGGMVSIEQEVEKGNNTLGAMLVKHGGLLQIEPNVLGADAVIDVPRLKIKGGTVIAGTDAKAGRSCIYSGMVSIEQEVEKGKELTNPNLTINGNAELNFINIPFEEEQFAYMDIADGGSFTMMQGSSIITENSTYATIFMEDGASFVDETEGAGVPGEVIVEQNLIPGAKLIATPVNGFQNSEFEYSDIYQWNESIINWTEITEVEPLIVSQGYKLLTSTLDTIAYIGDFSYGAQSIELTGNLANPILNTRGWNLAGNPYTSAIDWEQLSLSGIENTVYTYNELSENFEVYQQGGIMLNNADNMISTASGMFIKTHPNTASATLNFGAKSRVHELPGLYPKYDSKELLEGIQLSVLGNGKIDEIVLRFEDAALSSFESDKDAFKLFSLSLETPQLYTKTTDNNFLCIDVRDFPVFGTASIIPLNFHSGTSTSYTINADNINLDENYSVILKDLLTNNETDLRTTSSYDFNYTAGANDERFELIFNKTVGVNDLNSENGDVSIYAYGKHIFVNLKDIKGKSQISIYSITGQKLLEKQTSLSGNKYYMPYADGIYFVKVVTEKGVITESVVLQE